MSDSPKTSAVANADGDNTDNGHVAENPNRKETPTMDTSKMTLDEITDAVTAGTLAIDDVHFTEEQSKQAEAESTITVAELHTALTAVLGGVPARDGEPSPAELLYVVLLGTIAEGRQLQAMLTMLGLDEETAKLVFGDNDGIDIFRI